jgi:hypothetical protein
MYSTIYSILRRVRSARRDASLPRSTLVYMHYLLEFLSVGLVLSDSLLTVSQFFQPRSISIFVPSKLHSTPFSLNLCTSAVGQWRFYRGRRSLPLLNLFDDYSAGPDRQSGGWRFDLQPVPLFCSVGPNLRKTPIDGYEFPPKLKRTCCTHAQ